MKYERILTAIVYIIAVIGFILLSYDSYLFLQSLNI